MPPPAPPPVSQLPLLPHVGSFLRIKVLQLSPRHSKSLSPPPATQTPARAAGRMQPHQKAWQRKEALRHTDGDHGFIICSMLCYERLFKQIIKLLQPSKWLFSPRRFFSVVKNIRSSKFYAVDCHSYGTKCMSLV